MKKLTVLAALILAPLLAFAPVLAFATTNVTYADANRTVISTCTTGTESAPSGAAVGLNLVGVRGIVVHAETAGTMTAGGTLQAYLYNSSTGNWNRAPDLDLTAQALARQSWPGILVTAPASRVAWVPNGIGLAVTIYVKAF